MEEWITRSRPGYLGKQREEQFRQWDRLYGQGSWRLMWRFDQELLPFLGACAVYEDAYFWYFCFYPEVLELLLSEASDVFDDSLTNLTSGLDYSIQESKRTHIQDIAVRNCLARLGKRFQGPEPIQIRDRLGNHPLSMILSPGQVPFHKPQFIEDSLATRLTWWRAWSVEDWYQSNKQLQSRREIVGE